MIEKEPFIFNELEASYTITNPTNKPLKIQVGSPAFGNETKDSIIEINEAEIVKNLFSKPDMALQIFEMLKLNYYNCFILLEVPREMLVKEWNHVNKKGGDIDVIVGEYLPNCSIPNLSRIIAFQAKRVRISNKEEIRKSGHSGTQQAFNTVNLGFDETYLLHLLVREQNKDYFGSEFWRMLSNSVKDSTVARIGGSLVSSSNDSLFGMCVCAIAQPTGLDWRSSSTRKFRLFRKPAYQPWKSRQEFEDYRRELVPSISNILKRHGRSVGPTIVNLSEKRK
ncbi:hypothetical protein O3Q51_14860 [Cryomorphaceae bacterium 1068]|nr:hypothetical protein [Cryomorphaceae bacterium 1068]